MLTRNVSVYRNKRHIRSNLTIMNISSESTKAAAASDMATKAASALVQRRLEVSPVTQVVLPEVAIGTNALIVGPSESATESSAPKLPQYTETYRNGCSTKTYTCKICNHLSSSKKEFKTHQLIHNSAKCKDCKRAFKSTTLLQTHKCPFCKICNKRFSRWSLYVYHRKRHFRQTFKCEACQKTFYNKSTLTVPRPTYIGFYAHCPKCHRKFTSLLCNDCAQTFPSMEEFSKHSHELRTEHRCSICKEYFEDDFSLTSHKRSHAPQVKEYTRTRKSQEVSKPIKKVREPECNSEDIEENVNAIKEEPFELNEKQEPGSEFEVEIECLDESTSLKTSNGVTKMLNKNVNKKIDEINLDGIVKNEPENWYDVEIEPSEFQLVIPEQTRKMHHQKMTKIMKESMNKKSKRLANKVMPSIHNSNEDTGFSRPINRGLVCLVKQEPPELPEEDRDDVDSKACLALIKQECL